MKPSRLLFLQSDFFRNVSYQMIGTGLAQVLPFAATPILTRLYTQQDFALYTSFFAVASILVVGVGARYQFAIILPRKNSEAIKLFTLSIYITVLYSVLLIAAVWVLEKYGFSRQGVGAYFIPVYVLFFGLWTSFTYLSIRKKTFLQNAIAKVLQAVFYIVTAIILGLLKITLFGLILGKIVGVVASVLYLFKGSFIKIQYTKVENLKALAKSYLDYPKYGLLPAFLDIMSVQGLILILTRFYPTQDLGYFGLTALVLSAPLGLIGGSFKDVFYQRITSLINNREFERAILLFKRSALGLLLMGLPICAIIYFFGADIFKVVFGEKWTRSGEFASLLSISFLIQLIVSPLSSIFNAANKLKIASLWQTLYFITTFLTLGTSAYVFKLSIESLFFVYVIHEVILYLIYLSLQYWTLKNLK